MDYDELIDAILAEHGFCMHRCFLCDEPCRMVRCHRGPFGCSHFHRPGGDVGPICERPPQWRVVENQDEGGPYRNNAERYRLEQVPDPPSAWERISGLISGFFRGRFWR